jgi:signal transduction histidine kinase
MFFSDKVIGVLEALTQRERRSFTPANIDTLETLASIAAVAVQNARLFQQSDWVSEIVHEIRTPLTSIVSYADLLRRPNLKEAQREQFASIIQQEGERVNALVSQFLELARLESGRVTLERVALHLPTIAALSTDVVRPLAEKQNIELHLRIPQDLPPVLGDAQRIHQVLLNLLSNAVKYSGSGACVDLQGWIQDDQAVISIHDTGPGIPPEQIPSLFQKFSRLPGSERRATGAGLGLVITRQIIEAHGGRIWVESQVGAGTSFIFSLPVMAQA